jgi:hypothetical protein
MKTIICRILPLLAIALVLGVVSGSAAAQDNSTFAVTYYSNANTTGAPDATVRVINDGNTGPSGDSSPGDLCAAFYVFDDSQEMQECCSCEVSADGLIAESVNRDLLGNSLTSFVNHRGVIKLVSTSPNPSTGLCDPTAGAATAGIRGWATHIQRATSGYASTETAFHDANLASAELAGLQQFCSFEIILGSGRGTCRCGFEDQAF